MSLNRKSSIALMMFCFWGVGDVIATSPQDKDPQNISTDASTVDSSFLSSQLLDDDSAQQLPVSMASSNDELNQPSTSRIKREREGSVVSQKSIKKTRYNSDSSSAVVSEPIQNPPEENLRQAMDQPGRQIIDDSEDRAEDLYADIHDLLREFDATTMNIIRNLSYTQNDVNDQPSTAENQTGWQSLSFRQRSTLNYLASLNQNISNENQRIGALIQFIIYMSRDRGDAILFTATNNFLNLANQSHEYVVHCFNEILRIAGQHIDELSSRSQVIDSRKALDLSSYLPSSSEQTEITLSEEVKNAAISENDIVIISNVLKEFNNIVNDINNNNFNLLSDLVLSLLNHKSQGSYTKEQVQKAIAKTLGII